MEQKEEFSTKDVLGAMKLMTALVNASKSQGRDGEMSALDLLGSQLAGGEKS